MLYALIIRGSGLSYCAHHCSSLLGLLQRTHLFDRVDETSIESSNHQSNVPDLVLPHFLLTDWARQGIELCKKTQVFAKTFAVLCKGELKQREEEIPSALIDVDDFLICPFYENEFLVRIKRLLNTYRPVESISHDRATRNGHSADLLVGKSEPFLQAVRKIDLLAQSKASVVITGETGTGKELVSRAIHHRSARKSKPFIPVNCGAIPNELFENELFGHFKGAYTTASSSEKGLIAEAEGGTLFLDEVGTLSSAAQVKLLRFLQDGEYRPLGSSRSVVADVRVIAATNKDLSELVELKLFREDLHYRLNVLSLSIPPLRERGADVLDLAAYFLSLYAQEYNHSTPRLSEGALTKLLNYSWPGNIRELQAVIQRAIVLQKAEVLEPEDIELPNVDRPNHLLFRLGKSSAIRHFERDFIERVLSAHAGNISQAAKAAGKDRRSFQRLMSKYALDRRSFKTSCG